MVIVGADGGGVGATTPELGVITDDAGATGLNGATSMGRAYCAPAVPRSGRSLSPPQDTSASSRPPSINRGSLSNSPPAYRYCTPPSRDRLASSKKAAPHQLAYLALALAISAGKPASSPINPHEPQTLSTAATASKIFQRLTLIRFPAPPASRFPGIKIMSPDWHLGHAFVFFMNASQSRKRSQHPL